jgi:hypothetical protein
MIHGELLRKSKQSDGMDEKNAVYIYCTVLTYIILYHIVFYLIILYYVSFYQILYTYSII